MRNGMREEPNEDEEGDREEEPRGAASLSAWSQCHSEHWSNRLSGFALAESVERVCVAEQAACEARSVLMAVIFRRQSRIEN